MVSEDSFANLERAGMLTGTYTRGTESVRMRNHSVLHILHVSMVEVTPKYLRSYNSTSLHGPLASPLVVHNL